MATVVGIFEDHYKKNKPLPVVRPGSQTRRFTHVNDTVDACIFAWLKNRNTHYSIASKESYSIKELAKMFSGRIKYLPMRLGERYKSALKTINLNHKIININAKIKIKDYINHFLNS
jgi:UDP-glucose 4-epimerase